MKKRKNINTGDYTKKDKKQSLTHKNTHRYKHTHTHTHTHTRTTHNLASGNQYIPNSQPWV